MTYYCGDFNKKVRDFFAKAIEVGKVFWAI